MRLQASELTPAPGATHAAKRVGRGNSSGHGTYSGRGLKGQKARSGKKAPYDAFQGGQFPTSRKFHVLRGFNNKWRTNYQAVNVGSLNRFVDGTEVTPALLRDAGIVSHLREPLKLLADGVLERKLSVSVHRASSAARAKVEAAGGTLTETSLEAGEE